MLARKLESCLDFPFPVRVAVGRSRNSYIEKVKSIQNRRKMCVLEVKSDQASDIPWYFDYNPFEKFCILKMAFFMRPCQKGLKSLNLNYIPLNLLALFLSMYLL